MSFISFIILLIVIINLFATDKDYWEVAKKDNTLAMYHLYIEKYPNGKFVPKAKENIAWLEARNKDSKRVYNEFITNFPNSTLIDSAKKYIEKIIPPPPPPPGDSIASANWEKEYGGTNSYSSINEDEKDIFIFVEEMPSFPKGDEALKKIIQSNIKYPENARENNIQGTVYVKFVILKDGSIDKIKVVRTVDKELDAEAIRVIKLLK